MNFFRSDYYEIGLIKSYLKMLREFKSKNKVKEMFIFKNVNGRR